MPEMDEVIERATIGYLREAIRQAIGHNEKVSYRPDLIGYFLDLTPQQAKVLAAGKVKDFVTSNAGLVGDYTRYHPQTGWTDIGRLIFLASIDMWP